MPQHVTLSNGHQLDIPDGTPPEEVKRRAAIMEGLINPQWKGFGNLSDAGETIRNVLSYVNDPGGRVAAAGLNLNPVVGGIDLGITGINALKAVASKYAPSVGNVPDVPTISGLAADAAGVKPLSPDASQLQRYGEAAATSVLNPKQAISTAARMVGSTGGGDIGSSAATYFGGPEWEKVGRWIGSLVGSSPDTLKGPLASGTRAVFSGGQASKVAQSGENADIPLTFGALANTPGRLLEKAFGAIPGVGAPVYAAQTRMEQGVEAAKNRAAEQINQGPLPTSVDPNSIGGNLISLARTKVASIKADFKGRYNDLANAVGPDTLVDARPVLDAINQQAQNPTLSAAQKQDLLDRAAYLKSMTPGQPGYSGPKYSGPIPTTATNTLVIPLGQLTAFRSELGDDIQNMRGIDQTAQGPVRDAITNAMQDVYNQKGYGQEFNNLNKSYSLNIGPGTTTDKLEAVGGRAVPGKPGIYEGGMTEGQAHAFITRNLQSPSAFEPFVDPNSPYWRAVGAQFISTLGDTGQGGFRADTFATGKGGGGPGMSKISDPVLTQFLQDPSGGVLQPAWQDLRDAQTVGENASVAVNRHGLTQSIGSLAALEGAMHFIGGRMADVGIPATAALPLAYLVAKGMESGTMTDAMSGTGGSTPITDALYTNYPIAATSLALNNPDDPRNQPPQSPLPPSLLDQLKNPPPPVPPPAPAYSP